MKALVARLGRACIGFVSGLGAITRFAGAIGVVVLTRPWRFRSLSRQLYDAGALSFVLISASGMTVGMVLALQGYNTLTRFGAESSLGAVVGLSLIRELGPVLTALLVTGRAGSAKAAEIGAMVTTEQLDGLRMMSIDPVDYVATPRALAIFFAMPLLTAFFILFGILGGYLVGVNFLGLDSGTYLASLESSVDFRDDIVAAFLKAGIFGMLVGLISTYRGTTCTPTTEGVSAATTSTVVTASVCILVSDYVITALWGV
ncbi:MAG: MlaE family lipid ABC transporter permease subunit [Myxococcota bacterium]|jgi:phospholipid/cholesterol/gamma-HCH transport system permease protein